MSFVTLENFPIELTGAIFSHLYREDREKCRTICKVWEAFVTKFIAKLEFKERLPSTIQVFDEEAWKSLVVDFGSYELEFNDLPPIDETASKLALKKLLGVPQKEKGITWIELPKGVTINKVVKILQSQNIALKFTWDITAELEDIPLQNSYRFAITNSVYKESWEYSSVTQRKFVEERGFTLPSLLEALTLTMFAQIASKKFFDNKNVFMYCDEESYRFQIAVNCFRNGVTLGVYDYTSDYQDYNFYGSGAVALT
jgi:hypothetical protein